MNRFLQFLDQNVVLADGAMGTMLFANGFFLQKCYDEMNLTNPDVVSKIHSEYINAGANLIETNTFGASRIKLTPHGLADKIEAINEAAVSIVREASRDRDIFIGGSMGPSGLFQRNMPLNSIDLNQVEASFVEQAEILVKQNVDLLILETFYSFDELILALKAIKSNFDIPVATQFSLSPDVYPINAKTIAEIINVAKELVDLGADIVGTNCANGPATMMPVVETLVENLNVPVSVMPDASDARLHSGRKIQLANSPEYFAEYARRLVQKGARIIGGCCGSTPAMIKESAKYIKGLQAEKYSIEMAEKNVACLQIATTPLAERSQFGAKLSRHDSRPLISVELSPPRGVELNDIIDQVKMMYDNGVDVVNIPDGPRSTACMSPIALAAKVVNETKMEPIVHYCCRDRNLLGMQMDLMGAHALGIRNLLLVTGDPPKIGNNRTATPVFDVDAIGLIAIADRLNRGLNMNGEKIQGHTDYTIGAGFNPGALDIGEEARRFKLKAQAGANYFFSQPVYHVDLMSKFLAQVDDVEIALFVGILPLASYRNAEFLHKNVPGMQIPADILLRMKKAGTKAQQQAEGIAIAQEMAQAALELPNIKGLYMFPPFGNYKAVIKIIENLK